MDVKEEEIDDERVLVHVSKSSINWFRKLINTKMRHNQKAVLHPNTLNSDRKIVLFVRCVVTLSST